MSNVNLIRHQVLSEIKMYLEQTAEPHRQLAIKNGIQPSLLCWINRNAKQLDSVSLTKILNVADQLGFKFSLEKSS